MKAKPSVNSRDTTTMNMKICGEDGERGRSCTHGFVQGLPGLREDKTARGLSES